MGCYDIYGIDGTYQNSNQSNVFNIDDILDDIPNRVCHPLPPLKCHPLPGDDGPW